MPADPAYEEGGVETPLERSARLEAVAESDVGQDSRAEREADIAVGDVNEYIARTDPDSLPEAQAGLNAWEIPENPLEGVPGDVALEPGVEGDPLVSVFAAGTESEANIVRGLLEAEGIPVVFRDEGARTYGSVFSVSEARWGDILVASRQADAARAVIAAAQQPTADSEVMDTTVINS